MTYATATAASSQQTRIIVKIEGIPAYFANYSGTYDDGGTHGNRTVTHTLLSVDVSGGSIDFRGNRATPTTASVRIADDSTTRTYFSRHGDQVFLGAYCSKTATTVTFSSTSAMSNGDVVYIESECVLLGTKSGSTFTGCTRGYLGSAAQQHPNGTVVSIDGPARLLGARAWISLAVYDKSAGSWSELEPYLSGRIESVPAYQDGVWSLTVMSGLEIFKRRICTGFESVPVTKIERPETADEYKIYLDTTTILEGGTNQKAALLFDCGWNRVGCFRIYSFSSSYVTIRGRFEDVLNPTARMPFWKFITGATTEPHTRQEIVPADGATARAVYPQRRLCGDPNAASTALRAMLSDLGDGTNSAKYDVLPGLPISSTRNRIVRTGAGLTSSEVDIASWEAARERCGNVCPYIFGAEQDIDLIDFLAGDIAPMLGGYVALDSSGRICFKTLDPLTAMSAISKAISDSNSTGDNVVDDESCAVSHIVINSSYDYIEKKFRRTHNCVYPHAYNLWPDYAQDLEIKSKLSAASPADAETIFASLYSRWGYGVRRYSVVGDWSMHTLIPGDVVTYTNPRIPDMAGGTGVSSQLCEVISVAPDFSSGTVRLELAVKSTCELIAPSGTVTAIVGDLYTLDTTYSDNGCDDDWGAGFSLIALDPDDGTQQAAGYVSAIEDSTSIHITVTSGTIAVDDIVVMVGAESGTDENGLGVSEADYAVISYSGYSSGDKWG